MTFHSGLQITFCWHLCWTATHWRSKGTLYSTNQYAAPCNCQRAGATTMRHTHCWQLEERNKVNTVFFIPRGHHFKMSCWGCEFFPDPHPHPLCLEANPLISCVSMDLQGTFFIWEWRDEEGEERKSASFSVLFFFYMHFKIAAVLLCFVHKWWFESYASLNEKRRSSVGQSLFSQKPETIKPLQCSYVDRSFPCYSFF